MEDFFALLVSKKLLRFYIGLNSENFRMILKESGIARDFVVFYAIKFELRCIVHNIFID
jgi:hypothetical protein